MNTLELEEVQLIGLALKTKTFNANGQSAIDCGKLWQEFINGNYADKVPGKLSNDIRRCIINMKAIIPGPMLIS